MTAFGDFYGFNFMTIPESEEYLCSSIFSRLCFHGYEQVERLQGGKTISKPQWKISHPGSGLDAPSEESGENLAAVEAFFTQRLGQDL